jgi:hypothetical protein
MRSYLQQFSAAVAVLVAMGVAAPAQDLKITKKTTVGEASFSSETLLKGARERTAIQIAGAPATVTIRQCDLKRSVTVSDQSKAYLVANDPEDDSVNRAAALVSGDAGAPSVGGKVTVTSTVTDTGERKTLFGYPARHLKTTVVAASSPNACSPVNQKYQIDGWYIDLKDRAACKGFRAAGSQRCGQLHGQGRDAPSRYRQTGVPNQRDHNHFEPGWAANRRQLRGYRA